MRGRPMVAAALVPALLAVACGNDDENEAAEDPPTEVEADDEDDNDEHDEQPEEPEPEPEPETYEVQSGDTLSSIADEYDVTIPALVEANDLDDPDVLLEGQELVIPPSEPDETDEPEDDDADGDHEDEQAEDPEDDEGAEEDDG